ncbi:MAG: thioredoxin family protein [Fibromonadaceae bacterium]|nr:thioredoxin family protein [Fibromonadaceae bacterium]
MEAPKTELFYSSEPPKEGDTLYLRVTISEGWHINSNQVQDDFLIPSSVEAIAQDIEFGYALWPEPVKVYNEVLNMNLLLLQDTFTIALPIKSMASNSKPYNTKLKFTYQACSKICLAPKTIEISFKSFDFSNETTQKKNSEQPFLIYILFALLGGLLLNVMPCVLPVLFIKIFDLMRRFGESKASMLKWGLATSAGIIFSFAVIAAFILAIRAGSGAAGWGFQFQHPAYIAAMSLLVAVFALNLWGVFEIWLPGKAFDGLEKQAKRGGFYGAFAHGVLLVLLSTPCSAPFLGTAAGFAFSAPAAELLAIFLALATGLSMPYLILSIFPGWARKLPRPGNWMLVFKQLLGFVLLLTLVWLLWVFYRQAGADAALSLGIAVCVAAFFAWLSGLLANPGKPWFRFVCLWVVFTALCLLLWNLQIKQQVGTPSSASQNLQDQWLHYSQKKLDSLQNEGIAVWINGTADWCINCKVNEKNALESEKVKKAFAEKNVVKMRLDYTTPNEEALNLFKAHGRSGVPFDLLLTSKKEPVLLPEFLYPDIVIKALEHSSSHQILSQ